MKISSGKHRIAAYSIDAFLNLIVILFFLIIFSSAEIITLLTTKDLQISINAYSLFEFFKISALLGMYLVGYYCVIPLFWNGQTIGKKLFRIKTVCVDNKEVTFEKLFVREAIGRFLINYMTFGLGIIVSTLIMLYRSDRQSLHDVIAGTKVVDV